MGAGGFLVIAGLVAAGALALGVPLGTIFAIGLALLCPLMMMGMHGGHGGHSEPDVHRRASAQDDPAGLKPRS